TLKSPVEDPEETVQLGQRVFEEFLQQRNQYAPKYPVSEDQCRVLSSSSSSKASLHIVIPTYTFDNNNQHMLKFMQDFKTARSKQDQDENSLGDYIDMGVYSKNRGIRCLGSCKHNDMSRRFIRAPWHQSSVHALDAESFITNVRPDSTKVDRMPATNRQSDTANRVSLLQHVFDAVHNIFTEFEHDTVQNKSIKPEDIGQYMMQYSNYDMVFKLQRDHVGHCMMCKREHESDNGYLRLSEATGEIDLCCYRWPRCLRGRLGFTNYKDIDGGLIIARDKVVVQAESLYRLDP
ncbi:hypothetical protein BGX20_005901, partial [Mortierella sp. AD010]